MVEGSARIWGDIYKACDNPAFNRRIFVPADDDNAGERQNCRLPNNGWIAAMLQFPIGVYMF